ncbi:MAG: NAD(P) transhydrogenase subunit alpha [Holosporales bacterium]|nr:NAD(P) transhydrogenase subunit alpha [Holosporales bacterium]
MVIFVAKESADCRVAVTPEITGKYIAAGHEVIVDAGAGSLSGFTDADYAIAGAKIAGENAIAVANVVVSVNPLSAPTIRQLTRGTLAVSIQEPFDHPDNVRLFIDGGITAFALEFIPRTTRAQYMDVLSSQACLAGYKAVIEAAHHFNRGFPLLMTSAGTVPAARVLVIGAGVAGLQAIATAKRLGAVVSAFDVRVAAKEQVESLGAKFIDVDSREIANGVYATEMSDAYKLAQEEKLWSVLPGCDVVITTAQIPGKRAPVIVKRDMVESMKRGSIIIDLASKTGGNCECTVPGETVTVGGVTIIAFNNILDLIAADASRLFAKNIFSFLEFFTQRVDERGIDAAALAEDIISETLITHEGKVRNARLQGLILG